VVVVVVEVLLVVWLEGQRPSGCALQRSALAQLSAILILRLVLILRLPFFGLILAVRERTMGAARLTQDLGKTGPGTRA
jgi:hypothetical protein